MVFSYLRSVFKPELFNSLKRYNTRQFGSDLTAGIIVGIVALPMAIAFAIASGVAPEKGIVTAVIAGFIISALGGSKVQIGGPTGAFIIIVSGIVEQYGFNGLIVSTVMAGVILLVMGLAKLGTIIKFVPYPLIVGFTAGIALTIFSTQMKDLFGLDIAHVPSGFIEKWACYASHISTTSLAATILGVLSIVFIAIWQKYITRIPGSLVVIIIATAVVAIFNIPVETIGSRFGSLPQNLPPAKIPDMSFEMIRGLISPAITIAILGAIESLLSAIVADGMIGSKHNSNTELVAQGIANIVTPLFGGIPATGAIARTATNVKNGGRTPIAGMIHALVLLLMMLFLSNLSLLIPMPVLAAVLVVISYNMSGWKSFRSVLKSPRSDSVVMLVTFFLTIIFDLTVAIYSGMILASFLFMRRVSLASNVDIITDEFEYSEEDDPMAITKKVVAKGIEVYEVSGPFFFGVANKFRDEFDKISKHTEIIVLRMRNVPIIDATALNMLEQFYFDFQKKGIDVVLSGVNPVPLETMQRAGFIDIIGIENVHPDIDKALERANYILEQSNSVTHK